MRFLRLTHLCVLLGSCTSRQAGSGEDCLELKGRTACIFAPELSLCARKQPLILFLHGNGGAGRDDFFSLRKLAAAEGFLYAYPDGIIDETGRRSWNANDVCCFRPGPTGDDVAWLTELLDALSARYPVDSKRVFVVGHSLGGFMAQRLACDSAGRIAGVVSHAGALWNDPTQCRPVRPVSVLLIHGDADSNVKYSGGFGSRTKNPYPGAIQSFAGWAAVNRCKGPVARLSSRLDLDDLPGKETRRERYEGCPPKAGVELWTMEGSGHLPKLGLAAAREVYQFLMAPSGAPQ